MLHYEANNAEISVDLLPAGEPGTPRSCGSRRARSCERERGARGARADRGELLVDLSECEFIDSTVISVLISSDHERAREGQRLELRVLKGGQVARAIEVSGVGQLLTVHHSQ